MAKVADGDCILSIADRFGYQDYHSIWDDPDNEALKRDRPNPNTLVKDDSVTVSQKKIRFVDKAVDNTYTFVVKRKKPVKLRIVLFDKEDKPLAEKEWELTAPIAKKGKTGVDGLIEVDNIPPQATDGTLKVKMPASASGPAKPTPPVPPAITADSPPQYPRVIKADEYKDPKPPADPVDDTVEWTLKIGGLPSFNHEKGVQARLHNIGFPCDAEDDAKKTERAVKLYQSISQKNPNGSGKTVDVQNALRDLHDNP